MKSDDETKKNALVILAGWASAGTFPLGELEVNAALDTVEELDEQLAKRAAKKQAVNDRIASAASEATSS